MTLDDLDEQIRSHYEGATSKGEEAIQRIRQAVEAEARAVSAAPAPSVTWRRWALALTAAAVLGLVAGAGIMHTWIAEDPLKRVAKAVAFNYVRHLPDDRAAFYYSQIPFVLDCDKLGFIPVEPTSKLTDGFKLQGVRYCTMGDRIALQLRLTNDSQFPLTLYQFLPTEIEGDLQGAEESLSREPTYTIDGVGVRLWKERGLVMALAYHNPHGH